MRILHITTHLNKGGIATYLSSLARGLKKRGYSVVVSSSGGDLKELLLTDDIEHLDIPIRTKQEIGPSVLISYFILKKFILNNPIDIIHAHTRVTQVLASLLSKKFNIPMVTTCHGFFRARWHRRKFPCWGNKTIAISNQVKNHLISDFKVKEEDIHLIHNGVDLNKFKDYKINEINNLKKEIGILKDFFVVGTAGRISIVKGLEYLIKAMPYVLKEEEKVIFLLIGYGKEESKLKKIAKDLKADNKIIFFKPTKDIFEYLPVMDIFVMPSIQEGLGLSILEALAQRIPVIASSVGGIPDIIEDKITGMLVEPKNELAISKAILELMQDSHLNSIIRDNAYKKVTEEFTLEQMIEKTAKVYEGLLCRLN